MSHASLAVVAIELAVTPRRIDVLVNRSDDLRHGNVVEQPRKAKPAAWSAHALEPVIPQSRKQLLEVLRRDFLPYADVRHGHRIVSPAERQIQHGCNGVASTRREPHCKPKLGEYSSFLVSYLEEKFKSRDPMPCDKVEQRLSVDALRRPYRARFQLGDAALIGTGKLTMLLGTLHRRGGSNCWH